MARLRRRDTAARDGDGVAWPDVPPLLQVGRESHWRTLGLQDEVPAASSRLGIESCDSTPTI